ncbi:MAG: hypothetical protein KC636_17035 [Myxococcales bacterium]|nr:hypothetical protein [Myxococcales bacterium]
MSQVEKLVSALHAEGELDAEGGFTIDSEKAREKLRQYQLADPRTYVLLLVQAAVLRGATTISFDIDADDLRLHFDGAPFTHRELAELYGSMFLDRSSRAVQARQELALALNAAMALNPRYIRVLSGDAERRAFLELKPGREDSLSEVEPSVAGTWIHVKRRFRPGLLVEFFRDIRGTIAEELLLREHCRFVKAPLSLDGAAISGPLERADAVAAVRFEDPRFRGLAGFLAPDGDEAPPGAAVEILCCGVQITRHELSGLPPRFFAIVDAHELQKDVSQREIVRDGAYHALVLRARGAFREAATLLFARHSDGEAPVWVQALARQCLTRWVELWAQSDAAAAGVVDAALWRRALANALATGESLADDPLLQALLSVRLWTTVKGARETTGELLARAGDIDYTSRSFDGFIADGLESVVYVPEDSETSLLEGLFAGRARDATRRIERAYKHELNRRAFYARKQPLELGDGYRARAPIVGDELAGEVGLRVSVSDRNEVRVVTEGCLLFEASPRFCVNGLVAVVAAPLSPNSAFDGAHRNKTMARALHALLVAVERMMTALALDPESGEPRRRVDARDRELLLEYLIGALHPDYAVDFLEAFSFSNKVARRHLEAFDDAHVPALAAATSAPHPIACVPLFATVGAGLLSLVELAALAEQSGRIPWITGPLARPPRGTPDTLLVLPARGGIEGMLGRVFGKATVQNFKGELESLERRAEFFTRPVSRPRVAGSTPVRCEFEDGELSGELVVHDPGDKQLALVAPIAVYKHMRPIGAYELRVGLPLLRGAINDDDAPIDATWRELSLGGKRPAFEAALLAAVPRLIDRVILAHAASKDPALELVLLHVPAVVTGGPDLLAARAALGEALGDEEGAAAFARLLELLREYDVKRLNAAAKAIAARDGLPTIEAVRDELGASKRRPDPLAALRLALRDRAEGVLAVELLATTARAKVSLATVIDIWRERGVVDYVNADSLDIHYDAPDHVILRLSARERAVLRSLFGGDPLADKLRWLYTWAQRQAFERTPVLDALTIPDGDALIAVDVAGERVRGQLGLRRWGIDSSAPSSVRVCTGRRALCTVEFELDLALVGVLDVDDPDVLDTYAGVSEAEIARIKQFCAGQLDALIDELITRWPALNVAGEELASSWVLRVLEVRARGVAKNPRKLGSPRLRELVSVPVFTGLGDERYCLADLVDVYRERGSLPYLKRGDLVDVYRELGSLPHLTRGVGGDGPALATEERPKFPLVIPDHRQQATLEAIFPKLEDYSEALARARELARRKMVAEELPDEPPLDALFSVAVGDKGLRGHVWLPRFIGPDALLLLGDDGKVVERRELETMFPCVAAIAVPPARINAAWDTVTLARKQGAAIRRAMVRLYRELVATYEKTLADDAVALPLSDRVRRAFGPGITPDQIVRVQRELLLRLHRASAALKASERTLYRKLQGMPLFDVGNGRLISLDVALVEQPHALAHLELWSPSPPEWRTVEEEPPAPAPTLPTRAPEKPKPAPEPAPAPAPAPAPKPKPKPERKAKVTPRPSPAERLLEDVRTELRLVRDKNKELLSNAHLDALDCRQRDGAAIVFEDDGRFCMDVDHPVVAAALLRREEDPLLVSLLVSAVYTYLNLRFEEIEDVHEEVFHALHTRHVLSAQAARPRPRARSGEIIG